jgi:hypothetical protein
VVVLGVAASVVGAVAAAAHHVWQEDWLRPVLGWREYTVSVYDEDTGELLVRGTVYAGDEAGLLEAVEEWLEEEFALRASCSWGLSELVCSLCSGEGCVDVIAVVEPA